MDSKSDLPLDSRDALELAASREKRRSRLTKSIVICLVGLPIGIFLGNWIVIVLSVLGLIVAPLKLRRMSRSP